jgi:hypothetical protein
MKNLHYKGYFLMFERNPNGSIRAVADNDRDRFGVVFYDYPMTEIVKRVKTQCTYRLTNNIKEGYSL